MTELDTVWFKMLDTAADAADGSGRDVVANYIRLKATNDQIRAAGIGWLFDSAIEIAGRAMRDNRRITIERSDPHNFMRGSSNMVGSKLEIRLGVRCLIIEAGWARTPSDGIMRSGALAFARISHFGLPTLATDLRLTHGDPLPCWSDDVGGIFDAAGIEDHVSLLLDR